ncbi:MAG TPA: PadR family transcriptional regulator [Woeseiaceae bacterium]|nr:PadR family transcriptional regulator [Woeseiaceae bacterium]
MSDPTTLEFAILGLLSSAPQSGYDLMHVFETTAIGNYSSSPGAIYPALKRLEKKGLIDGVVDDSQALRPKKVFRPTASGRQALRRWLRAGITRDDVQRRLDELLLKFAFHSLLDARASRDFLARLAAAIDDYVAGLKEQRKLFPDDGPPHGRMAFEFGIEQYRACARWARRALQHFEERER